MKGIDISNIQGEVNLSKVKSSGIYLVISKVSEGITFKDSYAQNNISNTKKLGMLAGAYHFARFGNDLGRAQAEAEAFKASCPKDVNMTALDFEQREASGNMTEACLKFLDTIAPIAGERNTYIYANPSFIREHLDSRICRYKLWIANYVSGSPDVPLWDDYALWQYSPSGSVAGIDGDVDMNETGDNFTVGNVVIKGINLESLNPNDYDSELVTIYQRVANRYGFFSLFHERLEVDGKLGMLTASSFPDIPYLGGKFNTTWMEMITVVQDALYKKGLISIKDINKVYDVKLGSVLTGFAKKLNLSTSGVIDLPMWLALFHK